MKAEFLKKIILILTLTFGSGLFGQFAGGTGLSTNPYQVQTPAQLNLVRNYLTSYFIQIADIDLGISPYNEGEGWVPIGTLATPFRGNYNGNNFKIRNLFINRPSTDYIGLFGNTYLATLRNITVSNADITGAAYTGAISGKTAGSVQYANCASSGIVRGETYTGGLAGAISNRVTVTLSYSTCDVEGLNFTGGLFGLVEITSTITNAFARGNVNSFNGPTGGLIGGIAGSTVTNTFSCGAVPNMGFNGFGGLIGDILTTATINSSYWDIETSGQMTSEGGTGKYTFEMKTQSTYTDWDFYTPLWVFDEAQNFGYPYLAWSVPELPEEPEDPFAGGDGTEFDPYQVETAEQLNKVRDYPEAFFIQIADIDLGVAPWNEGEGWVPIGSEAEPFTGYYDGGNFTISGLFINRPFENDIGLFGCFYGMYQSTIINLNIADVNISGADNVGALTGRIAYNCQIISCSTSGEVTANANAGGVTGKAQSVNITNCFSSCSITSSNEYSGNFFGGIAGYVLDNCFISGSYSSGSVLGHEYVGGLVGRCQNSQIENCFSFATSESAHFTGGLIGESEYSYLSNCYSNGLVAYFEYSELGGLIGFGFDNVINNCYWDMDTSGLSTSCGGTGKTYTEMHEQLTYENWDFSTPVWEIDPLLNYGYPYLAWSTPPVNTTPFAGGDGTESNPYLVANPAQLDSVRNHLASNFKQVSDIDLSEYLSAGNPGYNSGEFWQPIGLDWDRFTGEYNGNRKKILNLKINRYEWYVGLFGATETGSVIRDLSIFNPDSINITGDMFVGSIAGSNYGDISNCFSNCNIIANETAGCLVGYNSGTIALSYSTGNLSVFDPEYGGSGFGFGGLAGSNNGGTITNCYARGKVTANEYVGGLVGSNYNGTIQYSYSSGKVTGTVNTGGLTGGYSGYVDMSFWDVDSSYQPDPEEMWGRTHAQMLDITTYDYLWDFTTPVWIIDPLKNDGYPYLAWSDPVVPIISFAGGTGTSEDPYLVANAEQLNEVRNHLDACFTQTADIDLSASIWSGGEGWQPIGDSMIPFTGYYYGSGYSITGLKINRPFFYDSVGLFGHINGADILFLNIAGAEINASNTAGILAGSAINTSQIEQCSSTGNITCGYAAGGLVGILWSSDVVMSFSNSNIDCSSETAGGLIGDISSSTISDCYARGTVSGDNYAGGFAGSVYNSTLNNCYSTSKVTAVGGTAVGGFAGSASGSAATSCYWNKESSGQTTSALGIAKNSAEMKIQTTFSGWDYTSVWDIYPMNNNGYPYLQWQSLEKPPLFSGGDGSEENPYQITNVYELQNVNQYLSSYYVVMNDIDASETTGWNDGMGFVPIGWPYTRMFSGSLNGNAKEIISLYINRPDTIATALFGYTTPGAAIISVRLINIDVTGKHYTAGLVGFNQCDISMCCASGNVTGDFGVGGLIGYNVNGNVSNSFSRANVTGDSYVGGLVGGSGIADFTYCYSTGSVICNEFSGGMVGYCPLATDISSYWDLQTSGYPTSYVGVGKTTAEMKTKNTFLLSGWNFTAIWGIDPLINDGYPHFIVPVELPKNVTFEYNDEQERVLITWDPLVDADTIKIFGSIDPYGTFSDVTDKGDLNMTFNYWIDYPGSSKMFYYIVAVREDKNISKVKIKTVNLRK